MKLSIYTSLYNLENGIFDYKEAIKNFCDFADEVVIATTIDCKDKTKEILQREMLTSPKIKLVITNILFSDYAFDGKLKNAALKQCSGDFTILLDADERIRTSARKDWEDVASFLNDSTADAAFIPVVDLFNSEKEFKSIGQKWYIAKNKPNISRGIVDYAKLDSGKIDHTKSDTTELIYDNGQLVNAITTFPMFASLKYQIEFINTNNIPIVYHFGWLDKEKRLKANSFWGPVWSNRAGKEVEVISSIEELKDIKYYEHNFPPWNS